jgi:hypothetical protein
MSRIATISPHLTYFVAAIFGNTDGGYEMMDEEMVD